MNRIYSIFVMIVFITTIPFSNVKAQEFQVINPIRYMGNDLYWGNDVILAAPLGFATNSYLVSGPQEAFNGVTFPLYLGYLSFCDEDGEKSLIFTPEPGYDARRLISFFDEINTQGYVSLALNEPIPMDDSAFCDTLTIILYANCFLYTIGYVPIGTAQNYNFDFNNKTEFSIDETQRDASYAPNNIADIFEFFINNLIITPKQ